jgi:predicted ester cyclase
MNPQEAKDFIQRYIDTISGKPKPEEILHHYIAEQPLKNLITMAERAFPLYTIEIVMMVAEDDLVSVMGRLSGIHAGALMGIAPTGKSFDVPLSITYRIRDGKIVDHWMVLDSAALVRQLGLVEASTIRSLQTFSPSKSKVS